MNEWYRWIESIATERTEAVESELTHHPAKYPRFASVDKELSAMLDETDEHPDSKATARDEMWMTYAGALAIEMYLAGARDGGRVYHAFITGELPRAGSESAQPADLKAPGTEETT